MVKTTFLVLSLSLMLLSACSSISTRPEVEKPQPASISKKSFKKLDREQKESGNGIDKTISSLLSQARGHENAGDVEKAISTIERALRIQPQNAYLWFYLGDLHFKKGDYGKSIQFARRSDSFSATDMEQRELNAQLILRAQRASADYRE